MQSPAAVRVNPIASWAPAAAALGIVVWAASIWWMVATLPSAGAGDPKTVAIAGEQIDTLTARIDALSAEVVTLQEERDSLTARIATLEAAPMTTAAGTAAVDPAPGEEIAAAGEPQASAFFTDGIDRYNCRDFATMAEAQEALDVNRPGDPNKIDTNNNDRACEDFKYRAASTGTTSTSVTPSAATRP